MANKQINARVALKHDIEANWITAGEHGFCPMAGEVIIYDIEANGYPYTRYKIGKKDAEGNLININNLPFETNIYVGPDEPQNVPVGFIWIDTREENPCFTLLFITGSRSEEGQLSFEYEEGMTWSDYVNSSYNVLGLYIKEIQSGPGVYKELLMDYDDVEWPVGINNPLNIVLDGGPSSQYAAQPEDLINKQVFYYIGGH